MTEPERTVITRLSARRLYAATTLTGILFVTTCAALPLTLLLARPAWWMAGLSVFGVGASVWFVRRLIASRRQMESGGGALIWAEGGRLRSVYGDDIPLAEITAVKVGRDPWWVAALALAAAVAPSGPTLQLETRRGPRSIALALADRSRRTAVEVLRAAADRP